jgi:hypothetical protein
VLGERGVDAALDPARFLSATPEIFDRLEALR